MVLNQRAIKVVNPDSKVNQHSQSGEQNVRKSSDSDVVSGTKESFEGQRGCLQCDLMATLLFHYLAINSKVNFPYRIRNVKN